MTNQVGRYVLLATLVAIMGVIFLLGTTSENLDAPYVPMSGAKPEAPLPEQQAPSIEVDIQAKAAAIYDITGGEFLYQRNIDTIFPLASLTKIMTAYVALDETQPDEMVQLSKQAVGQPGDEGLLVDDFWFVDDLVQIMLASSSNDAALALQEHFAVGSNQDSVGVNSFVRLMNKKAKALDLSETQFIDGSGLDVSDKLGSSFGSLRDVTLLTDRFTKDYPDMARASSEKEIEISNNGKDYSFSNTNEALDQLDEVMFSKTGYTDVAGGHVVAVIEVGGRQYFIGIMGSTFSDRFSDLVALHEAFLQSDLGADRL